MATKVSYSIKVTLGVFIVFLWFGLNQIAYEAKLEARSIHAKFEQAKTEAFEEIAELDSSLQELLMEEFIASQQTCAIEVDQSGEVIWLNQPALLLFDLDIGDKIANIYPNDLAIAHKTNSETHSCSLKTRSGLRKVLVKSWPTNTGKLQVVTVFSDQNSMLDQAPLGRNSGGEFDPVFDQK